MLEYSSDHADDNVIMKGDVEKKATLEKRLSRFVRSFHPTSAREMYDSASPFPALYYEESIGSQTQVGLR